MAIPFPRSPDTVSSGRGGAARSTAGSAPSAKAASPGLRSLRDAGASPLFPPHYQQPEEAKEAILHVVRRDPHLFGRDRARWRLADVREVCDWLDPLSLGGLSKRLSRLGISYQRGQEHVHSPDSCDEEK